MAKIDWTKLAGIRSSEITDPALFARRRQIRQASVALGLSGTIAAPVVAKGENGTPLNAKITKSELSTDEEPTSFETATTYNNFYELGTDKGDPARYAKSLKTEPWSIVVDGECDAPGKFTLEDILKPHAVEERIYRLRCVEAWSMVIPWNGFELGALLKRFKPNSKAKYVAFETLNDPELPGMSRPVLDWPYVEGLRIDEAMNPLAFMAMGIYGNELPNQNGAPLRLVVPWKYGYKSIKSIVRISFTEKQPPTSWNKSAPNEYGFYSNVNPDVSHPRWSQAKERRLSGDTSGLAALFTSKIETKFLNGYAELAGPLYADMDLKKYY